MYALSIVDRYYIFHDRSAGAGRAVLDRGQAGRRGGVHRARVPVRVAAPGLLGHAMTREAARLYGLVTTYYLLVSGLVVAGLALLGRWVLRLLAAPSFYGAYKALPWVALGWALYGLWVVFLVIAGRAKVTTRNFPAAIAGLAVNVVLLLVAGAGPRDRRRRASRCAARTW